MEQSNKQYLCEMIRTLRNPGETNEDLVKRVSMTPEIVSVLAEMLPELHGQSVIAMITAPEFYMSL